MKYFDKWVLTNGEPPKTNVLWVKPTDEDGVKGAEINAFIDGEWRTASSNSGGGGGNYPPEGGVPKSDLSEEVQASLDKADNAQEELVSGENIKTINGESILGNGNITISGGGAVDSVNGKTGVVVLDAEDVGAIYGVEDIATPQTADGTVTITLKSGDTFTLDLNHQHPQYVKYELVNALPASPESDTLYLIAAS